MNPAVVVVVYVIANAPSEMLFVERDAMVENFAAAASHSAFRCPVLPRYPILRTIDSATTLAQNHAAYLLFTLGLIGTGMIGVPVLAGSCAYAIAEAAIWRGLLEKKPRAARRFYGVLAIAMTIGLALDYTGLDAVKMLFWSAVVNGVLAPPLILLIVR